MTFAAHSIHYLIVLGGLVGVGFLLIPQLAFRGQVRPPRTPFEQQIADLRYTVEQGLLGTGATVTRPRVRTAQRAYSATILPVAVTSSAAAAGVHAAVGPAHLEEGFLIGSFFVFSTLFQLGWAALVATASPSRRLLVLGAGANAAFIVLWAVTRTVGLPFGLLPGAEGVGPWDLSAVSWEAVVVATCLTQLRQDPAYVGSWMRWSLGARTWLIVSAVTLGILSVTGAGA